MQPKLKPKTAIAWFLPTVIWMGSVGTIVYAVLKDSDLAPFGLVLLATAFVVSTMTYGAATSTMDTHGTQDLSEKPKKVA